VAGWVYSPQIKETHLKKVLLTLALSIINYQLSIAGLPAVKLCGKWTSSSCTYGAYDVVCNAGDNRCYCALGGCGVAGYFEIMGGAYDCKNTTSVTTCAYICANTTRTVTVTSFPNAAAVTCPTNGECEDASYKTVGDSESCGDGWDETTTPTLAISGVYSDAKGSFTYSACEKGN
jgi:hypothetical protein